MNNSRRVWFGLILIVMTSGIAAALLLTRGHNWGDDFAAYILQAEALVTGKLIESVQRSAFTIEHSSEPLGFITYPWGFPLLLAPAYAIFGIKILAFKAVLTLCYLAFLIAFFSLARTRCTGAASLLITAFMAFNLALLRAQNEVLSDLPFLLWSTLALALIERHAKEDRSSAPRVGSAAAIGLAIFMAADTRFNGFLLFVPLVAVQLARIRPPAGEVGNKITAVRYAAIPYIIFGLCYVAQAALLPSAGGGFRGGLQGAIRLLTLSAAFGNLSFYFLLPARFLQDSIPGGSALYVLLIVFFIFRLVERHRQDVPIVLYGLSTMALYAVLAFGSSPRYIYPMLPILLLFAFRGMLDFAAKFAPEKRRTAHVVVYVLWTGIALVSLGVSLNAAKENLDLGREDLSGPFAPSASPMFSFIRNATPADSIIIFFKPRVMRLLTDRNSFVVTACADLPNGNYVVLAKDGKSYNQIDPASIQACQGPVHLTQVFGKGDFEVYSIAHSP